jgi:hypothetical protein
LAEYSPIPWRIGPINYADVYDADGEIVALCPKGYETTATNAEFIVRACNSHDELLAALTGLMNAIEVGLLVRNIDDDDAPDWSIKMALFVLLLSKAETAISKAEAHDG